MTLTFDHLHSILAHELLLFRRKMVLPHFFVLKLGACIRHTADERTDKKISKTHNVVYKEGQHKQKHQSS